MKFNLWDTEVNRYLGQFEDEKDALRLVSMLISHHGRDYAEDLSLGRVTDEGAFLEPLTGATLLARVNEVLDGGQEAEERRGVVIASAMQVRRTVTSIEPMAVAGRAIRRITDSGHRRTQRS